MCGELAGMTKAIPIFLGFGLNEFSILQSHLICWRVFQPITI
jgi:phosphoenolpyruvate-protein kinase (PTS system EI component)